MRSNSGGSWRTSRHPTPVFAGTTFPDEGDPKPESKFDALHCGHISGPQHLSTCFIPRPCGRGDDAGVGDATNAAMENEYNVLFGTLRAIERGVNTGNEKNPRRGVFFEGKSVTEARTILRGICEPGFRCARVRKCPSGRAKPLLRLFNEHALRRHTPLRLQGSNSSCASPPILVCRPNEVSRHLISPSKPHGGSPPALWSDDGRFDYVALGNNFAPVLNRPVHDTASGTVDNEPYEAGEECKPLERHGCRRALSEDAGSACS